MPLKVLTPENQGAEERREKSGLVREFWFSDLPVITTELLTTPGTALILVTKRENPGANAPGFNTVF